MDKKSTSTTNDIIKFCCHLKRHLSYWICSVYKMISISILILASFSTCIKCFQLPNSNFVADVATHFNRQGIIYHFPAMARFDILRYHKTISKFRYFNIDKITLNIFKLNDFQLRAVGHSSSKNCFSSQYQHCWALEFPFL